ncbi:MAG: hypothetical protein IJB03_05685 [Alistipes sp.]|nr:hypothetical protein [Alistipes sp.]MBQ3249135.1 hypothetical protein [Alistipes sp.]
MKRLILVLTMVMLACTAVYADKKKKLNQDTDNFRYDIEYCQTASDGMVLVKVWSYSKRSDLAMKQCRKNAVHGVIFRGYAGAGTASHRPLVSDPTIESVKADYFEAFFADEGPYARYVGSMMDGSAEVRKVGKEYKVGVVVSVNKEMLRKHLEDAGIVRSLNSGF